MPGHHRRPRGRPKGSGKKDGPALARIADRLVADPPLKPTTAIKRLGIDNPADIRRLQVKWKAEGAAFLAAARERRAAAARSYTAPLGYGLGIAAHAEAIRRAIEGPTTLSQRMLEQALAADNVMRQLQDHWNLSFVSIDRIRQATQGIADHHSTALDGALARIRQVAEQFHQHLEPLDAIRRLQESLNPGVGRRRLP